MSELQRVRVRYNTAAVDDDTRWRLLLGEDQEILVKEIVIDDRVRTTQDWMEETRELKWHISCWGECEIRDGVASITTARPSALTRHLLKTVSWRILGTIDTMMLGWLVTGNPMTGVKIGALELLTKMVLYFLHERAWYRWYR